MTYCGAIGSVNVLAFMSTDLFDESQENPFLLQNPPTGTEPPRPGALSPTMAKATTTSGFELPLEDVSSRSPSFSSSPTKAHPLAYSPGRTTTFNVATSPRSILKRQSSYASDASTTLSGRDLDSPTASKVSGDVPTNEPFLPGDSELHKLLYSLTRFGLANGTDTAATQQQQQQQHQRQPSIVFDGTTPSPAASPTHQRQPSLTFDTSASPASSPGKSRGVSFASSPHWFNRQTATAESPTERRPSRRRHTRSYSDGEDGYSGGESDGEYAQSPARSRGSVSFANVKNLLRGGGAAARTIVRSLPDHRRKSMGTVSSRAKCRTKFSAPTIHTEAHHRVSTMKLGTKPMPTKIKHLAFPYSWNIDQEDIEEADPGMPPPKGQLRRHSQITLETLDKIGTRAACPIHMLQERSPDYSQVRARVDSYNHIRSPTRGLRRPSAWLSPRGMDGEDLDEQQQAEEFVYDQQTTDMHGQFEQRQAMQYAYDGFAR